MSDCPASFYALILALFDHDTLAVIGVLVVLLLGTATIVEAARR